MSACLRFRWPKARRIVACFASILALLPVPAIAEDITVFAAASLKNAMDDVAAQWEENTAHTATVSFAGSSALARQIQHGAPADVFISANTGWMDALENGGRIAPQSRFDLLRNRIVLAAHKSSGINLEIAPGFDLAAALGPARLAMALVDAVPAGIYGKAALKSLNVWRDVRPKVAQADNAAAALALVAAGEAPLGIVYATDAAASDRVRVVDTFPAETHPEIVYPAAAIADSENPLNDDFLAFLRMAAARAAFARQGFTVIE